MAHIAVKHSEKLQIAAKSIILLLLATVSSVTNAHLMVAQHGSLNYLNGTVYMVLSLPAAAFAADDDNDGLISITEFAQHRSALIEAVSHSVTLSDQNGALQLRGIMVSPVTPHDAPKAPSEQIIVMGSFSIVNKVGPLQFTVELFGEDEADQRLEITAINQAENRKQVFELSPGASVAKLDV